MSVIQTIREKAAWIIIGAIALALIAFIVQDAFMGRGGGLFGSGPSTVIGKVNGTKIEAADFERRLSVAEENYRAQNYPINEQFRNQIRESIWNDFVEKAILADEYEELGITVTDKELSDILYGNNPPQELSQQFTDSFGMYDGAAAYQAIRQLKKGTPQYQSFWGEFVPAIINNRQREKFTSLIGNSTYVPKWQVEKTNAENSQQSSISYVYVPYATIPDSTVQVTDEDIKNYVSEHESLYQQEKSRSIQYVTFDASATAADSAEIYDRAVAQKQVMMTTGNEEIKGFLLGNNSETPFYDGYVLGSKMQMAEADSIRNMQIGDVRGPYIDGSNYVVAKMIDKRLMPDSVKCRHILVKIADPRSGQLRTDSAAKHLIDSIQTAIQRGTPFDTLVVKFSDDEGSVNTGGEYEFASTQFENISKEFAETIFYGKPGDKKVVKVENASYSGYHYIEVLSQKGIEQAYKVAYLSLPIFPSDNTVNTAMGLASQFAAESRTYQQFETNATKRNLPVFSASDITPLASNIRGVGDNRQLVQWAFKTDKGEVADRPYQVGDKFVVPVVTQAYEKGLMPVEKARPLVEFIIRNNKKAEEIYKKIGTANTLEAIAQATNQVVQRVDSLMFNSTFIPNIGREPKVLGAAFNKDYQAKASGPIKGEIGVFAIKVENISAVANPNFDVAQMQNAQRQQIKGMSAYRIIDIMKKAANIKDNRADFF